MSYDSAVSDFIDAMRIEGIIPVEPVGARLSGGELIRFRCEGDGRGRDNGWAILYLDERPAGAFGNYRLGISRKWKAGDHERLSDEERERLRREWTEAKQRRRDERLRSENEAAKDAVDIWAKADEATPFHPYVAKKRLDPAMFRQAGEKLLVPMFDSTGAIRNLQRIGPDGAKRFLRGGRTEGLFLPIGIFAQRGAIVCIGEGVATMAAVNRATGYASVAAFSAKNIGPVARLWNAERPDLNFIICADDDSHLDRNVGLEAAKAAAEEIGARIAIPLGRAA